MKTIDVIITICLVGTLPQKYIKNAKDKRKIIERVKNDAEKLFGEYEIWGEFFGDDDDIYTLFLDSIQIDKIEDEPRE